MICDDSATIRRLLATVLSEDRSMDVVYQAGSGRDVIEHLDEISPDVLVLDVQMPEMDGIETVVQIRKANAKLPIVMFSSLTAHGTEETLDALGAGANDFALKPSGVAKFSDAVAVVKLELIPKIIAATNRLPRFLGAKNRDEHGLPLSSKPRRFPPAKIVAIGVSTGGPRALAQILTELPGDFPVPVVIVQHMPPLFTASLAERLNSLCKLKVREATDFAIVRPGDVWIARGDFQLEVLKMGPTAHLRLTRNGLENSVRPSVDPLFRTVAQCFGDTALGIILTGMGTDGIEGSRAIRQHGGQILVQDEATSAVWGMPRKVAEAGLADSIVPLDQISREITNRVRWGNKQLSRC